MRKYLLVLVFKPEAKTTEVLDEVKQEVDSAGGKILGQEELAQKKLAYAVNGFREGSLQVMTFSGPTDITSRLTEKLRVSEEVLRFLIKLEESPEVKEE
jgi:small subunit ribosomal protein S6